MEPRNPEALELCEGAHRIAQNHDAGATELLEHLLAILEAAVRVGGTAPIDVARIVLGGQPAMAALWHACAAAVADAEHPGTFARIRLEMTRAPRTLVRAASLALRDALTDDRAPLVLTLSYSSSVVHVLRQVATSTPVRVVCGEGRPRFEGRRLARELADSGIAVTAVIDAALTAMLPHAAAVVLGADAVFRDRWINKVGSFGLSAAAALCSTPVYVVATRDKFVPAALAAHVTPAPGPPDEVWPDRPPTIESENHYFESVPTDLATLFLTEAGPISPTNLIDVVERRGRTVEALLGRLT